MKPKIQFLVGSRAFFDGMVGFLPHDYDEVCIIDPFFETKRNSFRAFIDGKEIFFFRDLDKEGFINDCLNCNLPMRVGMFLVPKFAEYIGMTINDLKRLDGMINKLDDKHSYEKAIYDSYIKNNGFYLTDEQREDAYKLYKEYRKNE